MDTHETQPCHHSNDDGNGNLPHRILLTMRRRLIGCLIGSFYRSQYRLDSSGHTPGKIAGSKSRHNLVSNDVRRPDIGQGTLQAIPDFDSDLTLLQSYQKQHPVVGSLLAKLPRRRHTMREFFQRLAREGGKDQNCSLIASFGFMVRHPCRQRIYSRGRQHMGEIDNPPLQRRHVERQYLRD